MFEYSFKYKKQVIDAYLRGEGGYTYLAGKYGITNRRQREAVRSNRKAETVGF